ncbi:glycosyltransferase family 2 protein [soil metagenome]
MTNDIGGEILPSSTETMEDRAAIEKARRALFVPALSIVAPAYNERANITPLVRAIDEAMGDIAWELIIVDDDSPDGTADAVLDAAKLGYPVRCIRRVGRRGLASAVVEGALASSAASIAVIDADMQHDETLLPRMLDILQTTDTDLVIGSRHTQGGGFGEWTRGRRHMSNFATWCATWVIGSKVSDPMSGFFMIRRDVFHACMYDLSQQGYKILLDILTSSPRPLRIHEMPYVFRSRTDGESKLDVMVLAEFLFLLVEKLTRGLIPPKFVLFCAVGGIGLGLHLTILELMHFAGFTFLPAQAIATVSAMTLNYVINNSVTYRSQRLQGVHFIIGYLIFCAVCSIGALANIGVADLVLAGGSSWPVAGLAGALMSAVFNFGAATRLVWRQRKGARGVIADTVTGDPGLPTA